MQCMRCKGRSNWQGKYGAVAGVEKIRETEHGIIDRFVAVGFHVSGYPIHQKYTRGRTKPGNESILLK